MIFSDDFQIGNENLLVTSLNNKDSIFATGYFTRKVIITCNSLDLLNEITNLGENINKLINSSIDKKNILLEYEDIKSKLYSISKESLLKLFLSWYKKNFMINGFLVHSQNVTGCPADTQEIYGVTYENVVKQSKKILLIYFLFMLSEALHFFFNFDCYPSQNDINDCNTQKELESLILEERTLNNFKSNKEKLKKSCEFFKLPCCDVNFENLLSKDKTHKILKNILTELVKVLNLYNSYFYNSTENYYSINDFNIYHNYVYTDLFYVLWNKIIGRIENININQKSCKLCGEIFFSNGNQQYCEKCGRENKHKKSAKSQEKKVNLIKTSIVKYYETNEEFLNNEKKSECKEIYNKYKELLGPGKSKELVQTTIKQVNEDIGKLVSIMEIKI